LIERHLY